jgi:hypothetical protein
MATVSEETKKRVELMTDEDIDYEINLGRRSHFQRESLAWLQTVKSQREKLAKESREVPNTATTPTDEEKPSGTEKKEWYQRPIGIIGLTVFAGVIIALAIHLIKKHFGIPL